MRVLASFEAEGSFTFRQGVIGLQGTGSGFTRRRVIGAGAGIALGAAIPQVAKAATKPARTSASGRSADAIVVGAGTARTEEYGVADRPIVVVSRRGEVPETLRGAPAGSVLMATCSSAEGLESARKLLGEESVLVLGSHRVDLAALRTELAKRGWTHVLAEGGPHLLHALVSDGMADELCLTIVPLLVAGERPRITQGPPVGVPLRPTLLLESQGTLLGRWAIGVPQG